ncbi:MAG TPA: glycosyltransferase family 9 protein [Gemmatimonadales bacterium]
MPAGSRILVVRFGALGDVVLVTPLLRALRRRLPDAHVTMVTRREFAEVVERHPGVNSVMCREGGEPLGQLAARLAGEPFDVGLDLQRSLASRYLRARVPARAWGLTDKARLPRLQLVWTGRTTHTPASAARRYFAAARGLGVEPDGASPNVVITEADREEAAERAPAGCIALGPGSTWASKRWPPERWRALAMQLQDRGAAVVALGTARERVLLEGPGIVPAYGLRLRVAAAILARARVAVVHDSGLMHLAAAVGTPTVVLLGPTVAALGFLPEGANVRVIQRSLLCRPCSSIGSDHCPLGHHRCMIEIDPAAVAAAVMAA